MAKLDSQARSKVGIALCSGATSSLPSYCYTSLIVTKTQSHASKQNISEIIVGFCNGLDDSAPLHCASSALQHTKLDVSKTLLICSDSLSSAAAQCIKRMSAQSTSLTADKLVKFCAEINPSIYHTEAGEATADAAVDCFEASWPPKLSAVQRLSLCSNAPVASGPMNCTTHLQNQREGLRVEEVIRLCAGALDSGPAACWQESKGLGGVDERIQLCNAAKHAVSPLCLNITPINALYQDVHLSRAQHSAIAELRQCSDKM
jgi:hypothetical protein